MFSPPTDSSPFDVPTDSPSGRDSSRFRTPTGETPFDPAGDDVLTNIPSDPLLDPVTTNRIQVGRPSQHDSDAIGVEETQVGRDPREDPTSERFQIQPRGDEDPYVGTVISERYRVLKKIGEGGMGTVYLAEHIVIEKKVALKILSGDFARKADLVQRFMQEAKAASRIGHENIVDITDFGQTSSGPVFFAMEYLEGGDLATVIRESGPMPFERVRRIANQICRGLGAAHGKGIIHRDMKPENIFVVARDGRSDVVKILDFGIAKMSATDETNERLTRTGMIFGTPEYMSPEQARGDRPDHRVDIYAVGCILYEMLTGDVPFHAETFMGVLTKHMFEMPEPPTKRVPEANIPADVEAVVMRAIAKNRDDRYQSMREFALALAACEGGDDSNAWGAEGSGTYRAPPAAPGTAKTALSLGTSSQKSLDELKPRSKANVWIAIGAVVLLGAAVLALRPAPKVVPPPPKVVALDEPPVTTKPAVTPPVVPPTPIMHKLLIASQVPHTELFRGSESLGIIGKLPRAFMVEHGTEIVHFTATHPGYEDHDIAVRPNHDGTYVAKLELLPRRPTPSPPRKNTSSKPLPHITTPGPTPPANPTPPPVQTAPTTTPPPVKKKARDDLMNPFEEHAH